MTLEAEASILDRISISESFMCLEKSRQKLNQVGWKS